MTFYILAASFVDLFTSALHLGYIYVHCAHTILQVNASTADSATAEDTFAFLCNLRLYYRRKLREIACFSPLKVACFRTPDTSNSIL